MSKKRLHSVSSVFGDLQDTEKQSGEDLMKQGLELGGFVLGYGGILCLS